MSSKSQATVSPSRFTEEEAAEPDETQPARRLISDPQSSISQATVVRVSPEPGADDVPMEISDDSSSVDPLESQTDEWFELEPESPETSARQHVNPENLACLTSEPRPSPPLAPDTELSDRGHDRYLPDLAEKALSATHSMDVNGAKRGTDDVQTARKQSFALDIKALLVEVTAPPSSRSSMPTLPSSSRVSTNTSSKQISGYQRTAAHGKAAAMVSQIPKTVGRLPREMGSATTLSPLPAGQRSPGLVGLHVHPLPSPSAFQPINGTSRQPTMTRRRSSPAQQLWDEFDG
jgi:hypothetical protein